MLISEKNLMSTVGFIVSNYEREAKKDPAKEPEYFLTTNGQLSGLSLLLVGYKEKRHIDLAVKQVKDIQKKLLATPKKEKALHQPHQKIIFATGDKELTPLNQADRRYFVQDLESSHV
jgi:hypothetical protein